MRTITIRRVYITMFFSLMCKQQREQYTYISKVRLRSSLNLLCYCKKCSCLFKLCCLRNINSCLYVFFSINSLSRFNIFYSISKLIRRCLNVCCLIASGIFCCYIDFLFGLDFVLNVSNNLIFNLSLNANHLR